MAEGVVCRREMGGSSNTVVERWKELGSELEWKLKGGEKRGGGAKGVSGNENSRTLQEIARTLMKNGANSKCNEKRQQK